MDISHDTPNTRCNHCAPVTPRYTIATFAPLAAALLAVATFATVRTMPGPNFMLHYWMSDFMAAFFLLFGALKALSLRSFARSYAAYDPIARMFPAWAYAYPFVELALGAAYLFRVFLPVVNSIAFVVMAVAAWGVYGKLARKESALCACIGGFFEVPITWFTLFEYSAMAAMALEMMRHL